ncbi:MAG: rod shape-determining protein MreC, partial [Bacteroidetes bacterium]|nr:rod shape-determining protein MreC [Bacteroidota bacterium]
MRSLFLLAIKYHAFLVFLVLEIVSLVLIFNYNSFQRASFLHATEQIVGSVHETSGEVTKFFTLGSVNKQLNAENA